MTDDHCAKIASEWQAAYVAANGKPAPYVEWQNGWFKINGSRHCMSEIQQRTARLREMAKDKK